MRRERERERERETGGGESKLLLLVQGQIHITRRRIFQNKKKHFEILGTFPDGG